MEHGVLGDPGAHALTIQERKEQDTATIQHLNMVAHHVLALQLNKKPAQVHDLLQNIVKTRM